MALRQCEKCGDSVDEAKAFCPGCGHAFVEEQKRSQASNFDAMDSTVQLGQTMYNQMLSDMGLNISKSPDAPEKRIEVITPVAPVAVEAPKSPQPALPKEPKETKKTGLSKRTWIIIAVVAGILLLALLVVAVAAGIFIYFYQFR